MNDAYENAAYDFATGRWHSDIRDAHGRLMVARGRPLARATGTTLPAVDGKCVDCGATVEGGALRCGACRLAARAQRNAAARARRRATKVG